MSVHHGTADVPARFRSDGVELSSSGGATFIDPATAAERDSIINATANTTVPPTNDNKNVNTTQSTPIATRNLKFTIAMNSTNSSSSSAATGGPSASVAPSLSSPPHSPPTGGPKFVIVKNRPAVSPAASPVATTSTIVPGADPIASPSQSNAAAATQLPSPSQTSTSLLSGSPPHPALAETAELLLANASKPFAHSSPVLLARLSASEVDDDVPLMDLPSSHPAAFARPPTPPSSKTHRRSISHKRRSQSTTRGTGSALMSPLTSGRDQFPSSPPHKPISTLSLLESLDSSGNEFSTALRAALAEAVGPSTGVVADRSAHNSWKSRRGETIIDNAANIINGTIGSSAESTILPAMTPPHASNTATPTEEATERELRKAAIRQKNAMHMRLRNASSGGTMLTGSRGPPANRAAAVAAANASNSLKVIDPSSPSSPVFKEEGGGSSIPHQRSPSRHQPLQRSSTFQGLSKGSNNNHTNMTPHAALKITSDDTFVGTATTTEPNDLLSPTHATHLLSSNPPSDALSPSSAGLAPIVAVNGRTVTPTSSPPRPPQRTRSGILKTSATPTTTTTGGTTNMTTPVKRQPSGILRTTSKTGTTHLHATNPNPDVVTPIGGVSTPVVGGVANPPIVRTNTASRVGFIVPEGMDSSSSSSSDDDSDGQPITPRQHGRRQHARKASVMTSVGIPSLHVYSENENEHRARKEIFVQQGDQLLLTSVSTTASGIGGRYNQSHQAANVMVLSVSSIFTRLRLYTDLCFYTAMLGIILTVVNKELYWNYPDDSNVEHIITAVRALTSLSTIALIYFLYEYYRADFQFLQLNRVYLLRSATWNTQLIWQFGLEVLICLIHEPPFLEHDVDLSIRDTITMQTTKGVEREITPIIVRNPWSLFIALRFYFFLRLILSKYYTGGTKILGLWFNFNFSPQFAIRNMLYSHPILSLIPIITILIGCCSYSLYVFEREVLEHEFTFGTALWIVMITITAVGYGDHSPYSSGGRAICILVAFIGIMVTAVLVAAVHQKLTLLPYEGRMVEFLERDSNGSILKYYAARCISRAWRYYRYRAHAIRMVKNRSFNFLARSNLVRHKSNMLQGIFDFQTARKQIQAYDRRYHSEQLFRAMLEGLYDKLEGMTLDFNVFEAELDLSYEEQRKLVQKQSEILEAIRHNPSIGIAAGGGGGGGGVINVDGVSSGGVSSSVDASVAGGVQPPPEHGRLALLRTSSMPVDQRATDGKMDFLTSPPTLTRPSSLVDTATTAAAAATAAETNLALRHGRHKSMRNSNRYTGGSDTSTPGTPTKMYSITPVPAPTTPTNYNTSTNQAQLAFEHALENRRGAQLNNTRASTVGSLDLAAAAAAAAARHRHQVSSEVAFPPGLTVVHRPANAGAAVNAGSLGVTGGARSASSQDLLTGVVVETPRGTSTAATTPASNTPAPNGAPGVLSIRLARRASLQKDASSVTNDLLSVVAAMDSTNNPEIAPAPTGRIRFGESDFAAHRAAAAPRAARQTILLQRGGSVRHIVSSATPNNGEHSPDPNRTNLFIPVIANPTATAPPSASSSTLPSEAPNFGSSLQSQSLYDDRTHSPQGRPTLMRSISGGSALRAAAAARASHAAGGATPPSAGTPFVASQPSSSISSEQFDRMMLLLANVSDRLANVESHLAAIPTRGNLSPRKHAHSASHGALLAPPMTTTNEPTLHERHPSIPNNRPPTINI